MTQGFSLGTRLKGSGGDKGILSYSPRLRMAFFKDSNTCTQYFSRHGFMDGT